MTFQPDSDMCREMAGTWFRAAEWFLERGNYLGANKALDLARMWVARSKTAPPTVYYARV